MTIIKLLEDSVELNKCCTKRDTNSEVNSYYYLVPALEALLVCVTFSFTNFLGPIRVARCWRIYSDTRRMVGYIWWPRCDVYCGSSVC
jgi:hypothetical protein